MDKISIIAVVVLVVLVVVLIIRLLGNKSKGDNASADTQPTGANINATFAIPNANVDNNETTLDLSLNTAPTISSSNDDYNNTTASLDNDFQIVEDKTYIVVNNVIDI